MEIAVNNGSNQLSTNVAMGSDSASVSTEPDAVNVVIIGCGYAGALIAKSIDLAIQNINLKTSKVPATLSRTSSMSSASSNSNRLIRLTVIDRHDVVWLKISAIRAAVTPGWAERTQIPISEVIKEGKFIQGNVTAIDKNHKKITVSLKSSEEKKLSVPYDVLVCASGALNGSPADLPESITLGSQIREYLDNARQRIAQSASIVIIGGGMTSVEFAGEIRAIAPDKKITIVCAAGELLTSSIAKPTRTFMKSLHKRLEVNRIEVVLNERSVEPAAKDFVESPFLTGKRTVKCQGKKSIELEADLVIWAGSWKFNNKFYPPEWVNDMGELNIRDTFQLENEDSVFAFGDISSLLETKQAITLPPKVPCIVENILAVVKAIATANDLSKLKLRKYRMTDRPLIYLPVGPNDGVSISKLGFTYGAAKTSQWKGKDLFVNKFWNLMTGHDAPPIANE